MAIFIYLLQVIIVYWEPAAVHQQMVLLVTYALLVLIAPLVPPSTITVQMGLSQIILELQNAISVLRDITALTETEQIHVSLGSIAQRAQEQTFSPAQLERTIHLMVWVKNQTAHSVLAGSTVFYLARMLSAETVMLAITVLRE